jgi:starch phosphorylase
MNETTKVLSVDDQEHVRTGVFVNALKRADQDNLFYVQGRDWDVATYRVCDRLPDRWISSAKTCKKNESRTVFYLSAEFLLGPYLTNNLLGLGITEQAAQAAEALGFWTRMSILNAARLGRFSSHRSIRDRCDGTWKVASVPL